MQTKAVKAGENRVKSTLNKDDPANLLFLKQLTCIFKHGMKSSN